MILRRTKSLPTIKIYKRANLRFRFIFSSPSSRRVPPVYRINRYFLRAGCTSGSGQGHAGQNVYHHSPPSGHYKERRRDLRARSGRRSRDGHPRRSDGVWWPLRSLARSPAVVYRAVEELPNFFRFFLLRAHFDRRIASSIWRARGKRRRAKPPKDHRAELEWPRSPKALGGYEMSKKRQPTFEGTPVQKADFAGLRGFQRLIRHSKRDNKHHRSRLRSPIEDLFPINIMYI